MRDQYKRKRRGFIFNVFLAVLLILGVGLVAMPLLAEHRLAKQQDAVVSDYNANGHKAASQKYLSQLYKQQTTKKTVDPFAAEKKPANKTSDTHSIDVAQATLKPVATLSIPRFKEVMPVYGVATDEALNYGAAVTAGSGDLLGGKGKNPAIAGHSGKDFSQLFTNLLAISKGDRFYLRVKGKVHAYEVDQLRTVRKEDFSLADFKKNPNKDYVSLYTCKPLYVNSHRWIVRGHRIKYDPKQEIKEQAAFTPLGSLAVVSGSLAIEAVLIWTIKKLRRNGQRRKINFENEG